MRSFKLLIILLIGFLPACGGGGGGEKEGRSTSPQITALTIESVGTGSLDLYLEYADPDADITTIAITLLDSKGMQIESQMEEIALVALGTTGGLQGSLDFSGLATGEYSLQFELADSRGQASNKVLEAFSATQSVGKSVTYRNPYQYLHLGDTDIGDLNGDSRNDVVAIQGSNNTGDVLIYYQNSSGTLDNAVVKNFGVVTRGVVIADVNNDGKADLLLSGISKNTLVGWPGRLVVILQDPVTGQLLPAKEYTVSSSYIFNLAVADLNGDNRNDVIVMSPDVGLSGKLSIFFQNSDGTLGPEVPYDKTSVKFGGQIHVADMNNDGMNDIVVQSGLKEFAVILQTAPGVFNAPPDLYTVQTSYWPDFTAFALGDVNGDGLTDVVVADEGNNGYLNIFLQNSQGKLNPATLVQFDVPFGLKIIDFTGDGLNDIVYDYSGGFGVLPQQPNHTFGPTTTFFYPATSFGGSVVDQALSVGDVSGDGRLDVVVTWSSEGLFVFPNSTQLHVK